jgi:outer membrane protein OmpA-like peptidoglycan-associated protein
MNTTAKIMKSFKSVLLIITLLGYTSLEAQNDYFSKFKPAQKWSVGAQISPTFGHFDAPHENLSFSGGLHLKYSASQTVGFKASANMGKMSGSRNGTELLWSGTRSDLKGSYEYTNNFIDADVSALITAGNWSFLRPLRKLQTFVSFGVGIISSDVEGEVNDASEARGLATSFPGQMEYFDVAENLTTDYSQTVRAATAYSGTDITFPLGVGVKYNLNDKFDLGLEWKTRLTRSDDLDARDLELFSSSSERNRSFDSYSTLGVQLSFKFGDKDRDDHNDWLNPVESLYTDMDSINKSLKNLMADTDGDGVADHFDKDNETPEGVKTYGDGTAVDTDGDGVPDSKDKEIFSFVTDVDADGVAKDDDGDGIPNALDEEPNSAAGAMVDSKGKAFEIKESSAYNCDNVSLPTIMFDNGSSKIAPSSYGVLYTLAEKLRMCPSLSITATGYTKSKSGERLAWKRANSIIDHLEANYGIERSRVSTDYTSDSDVDYASRRIDFSQTGK